MNPRCCVMAGGGGVHHQSRRGNRMDKQHLRAAAFGLIRHVGQHRLELLPVHPLVVQFQHATLRDCACEIESQQHGGTSLMWSNIGMARRQTRDVPHVVLGGHGDEGHLRWL